VQPEPGRGPGVTAGDELSEQLDIVVSAAEGTFVPGLLGRPHRGGEAAGNGAVQAALEIHHPQRNAVRGIG
jgi:hypothetical protein